MDEYEKLLIEYVRDNKITMEQHTQLNNCNLLNIKENIGYLRNIKSGRLDTLFCGKYKDFIKLKEGDIIFKNKIIFTRLLKKSNLQYTTDQEAAINQMIKFITEPDEIFFGLFGYAGTGKTTTIIDFLMNCIEMKYINTLIFTAPTNKALNVIKTKISDRIRYLIEETGAIYNPELSFEMNCDKLKKNSIVIDFQTIHKFLKYKSEYNTDGEIVFTKDKANVIGGYDVIVIDECSMIPLGIIYEIFKEANKIKTKIIFTGDPAQLPPVNEKHSAIFMTESNRVSISRLRQVNPDITLDEFDKFCNKIQNMNKHILKEIVRTNNNSIIKCSNVVRDWIYNIDEFIKISKYTNVNFNIYSFDKTAKTKTTWYKEFEKIISNEKDTIIISWTNEEVSYYNNYIRKSLFNKSNINEYEENELLILNEFHISDSPSSPNNKTVNKIKFNTSEKIIVKSIQEIKSEFEKLGKIKAGSLQVFQNHKSIEGKYNKFIDGINKMISGIGLNCFKMKVIKIDEPMNEYDILVLRNNEQLSHKNVIATITNEIKKFRDELQASYQLMSIDNNIIKPLYNEIHLKIINKFASVSYGYAITCHKAQGSNYKNVFVDFADIVKNNNFEEMKRCMYTAVSRTINNLYILI